MNNYITRLKNANKYRTQAEKQYFLLAVIVSVGFYLYTIYSFLNNDMTYIFILLFLLAYVAFVILLNLFAMASIRINAVKIGPNQFPEIWRSMQRSARILGMDNIPDIYVVQVGGELNAFAVKLIRRRLIVLYSDLAEAMVEDKDQKQLDAVIGHELGHHALGHTGLYNLLLSPSTLMPGLDSALSRAREYSADRVMKKVVPNQEATERALIKLSAGKSIGNRVNIDQYTTQLETETGLFISMSEVMASHPHLPKRIVALRELH